MREKVAPRSVRPDAFSSLRERRHAISEPESVILQTLFDKMQQFLSFDNSTVHMHSTNRTFRFLSPPIIRPIAFSIHLESTDNSSKCLGAHAPRDRLKMSVAGSGEEGNRGAQAAAMTAARRTRAEWSQRDNHSALGAGDDNEKKRVDGTTIEARGGGSGGKGGKGAPMGGERVW
jgi:hypothetical protein